MSDTPSFDFLEMINQAADMAADKVMKSICKNDPLAVAVLDLLSENGIHGLRAWEFVEKMNSLGAIAEIKKKEVKEDDQN